MWVCVHEKCENSAAFYSHAVVDGELFSRLFGIQPELAPSPLLFAALSPPPQQCNQQLSHEANIQVMALTEWMER